MISKIKNFLLRLGSIPQINRITQGKIEPIITRIAYEIAPPIVLIDRKYRIKTDERDSLGLIKNHEYEPEIRNIIKYILKNGGFAMDIGANIGYHTVLMSDLADQVIAFEPDHENLNILRWNLRENRCTNVVLIPKAVYSISNAYVKLWKNQEYKSGHSIAIKAGEDYINIETVRLDDVVSPRPIRLIKMDIEGAEYDAILGLGSLLEYVDYIIYEHWGTGISKDPSRLLDGWKIINITGDNYLATKETGDIPHMSYPHHFDSVRQKKGIDCIGMALKNCHNSLGFIISIFMFYFK